MDLQYLLSLQSFRNATKGIFNSFFIFISQFGEVDLPIIITIIFYYAVDKMLGKFMLLGNSIALFANGILKLTACVYRPWIREPRIIPPASAYTSATGYSFPSAHASISTGVYGTAAVYYRKRTALCIWFAVLLSLIMFSRNYLGVHTPQDVLAGFSITVVFMLITYKAVTWAEKKYSRDIKILIGSIILATLSLIYFSLKSYPMDYTAEGKLIVNPAAMVPDSFYASGAFLGAITGWFIERRYIKFTTNVSTENKVLRCISGTLAFSAGRWLIGIPAITLFGMKAGYFILAFITIFYVSAIHPLIFTHTEKV